MKFNWPEPDNVVTSIIKLKTSLQEKINQICQERSLDYMVVVEVLLDAAISAYYEDLKIPGVPEVMEPRPFTKEVEFNEKKVLEISTAANIFPDHFDPYPPQEFPKRPGRFVQPGRDEEIIKLSSGGMRAAEIAEKFGINVSRVYTILKNATTSEVRMGPVMKMCDNLDCPETEKFNKNKMKLYKGQYYCSQKCVDEIIANEELNPDSERADS